MQIPKQIDPIHIERFEFLLTEMQDSYGMYPVHPRQAEFKRLCLGRNGFRARAVLEILLDDHPMQTPFKWVLAAGLCGWVIDPSDSYAAQNVMYLEVERILEECTAYAVEGSTLSTDAAEIVGRYILPGSNFHRDIRYPIAGPNPQEILTSGIDLEIELESELKGINSLNYCLLVLHWMGEKYNPDKHLAPSWNLIRKFSAAKHDTKASIDSGVAFFPYYASTRLRDCWRRYMPSFSMLYTANYVNVTRGRTLLEMIVSTELNTRKLNEFLPEWLGKSAYYYANYLQKLENTGHSSVGEWLNKTHEKKRFAPKKLNSKVESEIINVLKNNDKSIIKPKKEVQK